jgi:hypothetical protein
VPGYARILQRSLRRKNMNREVWDRWYLEMAQFVSQKRKSRHVSGLFFTSSREACGTQRDVRRRWHC